MSPRLGSKMGNLFRKQIVRFSLQLNWAFKFLLYIVSNKMKGHRLTTYYFGATSPYLKATTIHKMDSHRSVNNRKKNTTCVSSYFESTGLSFMEASFNSSVDNFSMRDNT